MKKTATCSVLGLVLAAVIGASAHAGNVTVDLDFDKLTTDLEINGDSDNNDINIAYDGNRLVVRGLNGTTVNNSTQSFVSLLNGLPLRNVDIDMGNGNDSVLVDGLISVGEVEIDLGRGADELDLFFAEAIEIKVETSWFDTAPDRIRLWGIVADIAEVYTGRGADLIGVLYSSITDLFVDSGFQDDEVVLVMSRLESMDIELSLGDDEVRILGATSDNAFIDGGNGWDYDTVDVVFDFVDSAGNAIDLDDVTDDVENLIW